MKLRKYVKASYTIEAAFLLPMIITIIVFIIYWMFFFHDRAVLSSAAYSAALKGSQMINGENVLELTKIKSEQLIKDRLIATKNLTTNVELRGKEIVVTYVGNLIIPYGTIFISLINENSSKIEVKAIGKAKTNDAVKFIKECRFIENAMISLKGKNNGT